ncbi:MAG: hypothetical protein ACLRYM_14635 [Thomasclavelia ramosa]
MMIFNNITAWNNLSFDDKKAVVAILIGLLLLIVLVCIIMIFYISKLRGKAESLGKKHKTAIQKAFDKKGRKK